MKSKAIKKIKKNKRKTPPKIQEVVDEMIDMDPRQQAFAIAYMDPGSLTYGNALQSALKAGFSAEYADNILALKPRWLSEIIGKMNFMDTVKSNIKKHLELKTLVPVMTAFGPYFDKKTKKILMREDAKMLKIQQDMTMFVAEKLMPEYKRKEKFELPPGTVEIKQIIIMAPDGASIPYNTITSAIE